MDEQREKEFQDLQVLIYKELPELIHKIAHASFMNCEKGARVFLKEDMKFITPFLEETRNIFEISLNSETAAIEKMTEMHETKEYPFKMNGLAKLEQKDDI